MPCPHERALGNQYKDNLVGMVISMKGGPCTGKTTLARALAKSLRCTLTSQDDFLSCTSDAEMFLSSCPSIESLPADHFSDLSYEVLWRVAEAQLDRHHSVVIDSRLHTPAQLDRFKSLSTPKSWVIPIVIECQAQDKSEWKRRLIKTYSPREVEKILEEDDYDTGDIPKLTIDTSSQLGIEEHLENMENFILSCRGKQLSGDDMPISELKSGCTDCKMAFIEKVTAHLPRTLKHQAHEHGLALVTCARSFAFRKFFSFHCNGCGDEGINLHYACVDKFCRFTLHDKCALSMPLTITPSLQCSHTLVLTSRPHSPDRWFCDYYLCEKERRPEDWIYFCEECEHHYHIKCANPEFYT